MRRSAPPRENAGNELDALRSRLKEAEETLDAIRLGQVDALMVSTPAGPRVFTLEGADHRYRRLVETMSEGALIVSTSGVVLYSNAAFATMVTTRLETVVGRPLADFVDARSRPMCAGLLAAARTRSAAEEITLRSSSGASLAAYVSVSPNDDGGAGISVIVTNLAAQKRNDEIVASERLASAILDQAADAIVVCDTNGIVTRASRAARDLASDQALRQHVFDSFPLRSVDGTKKAGHPASRALAGEVLTPVEMVLDIGGRDPMPVICTAVPLSYEGGEILGCIMSIKDITLRRQVETERAALHEAERAARTLAEHARANAEATNRTKDEFLATVSHELRTPLNAIVGWSRLLSDDAMPEDRRRHAVNVIRRNADAQARLIEDLLDVSRIISGQMRLEVKSVEPVRVITAVIETVRPALDAKEIALEVVLDSDDPSVLGDEARLQQIIWNLLSNAVKFTPRGGSVRLEARRDADEVILSVRDTGEGVEREFLPFVFDRFRQADGSTTRLHGGLGLGLAIVRHLVELHGGLVDAASDGPGMGATFTVRLPVHATPPPEEAPAKIPSVRPVAAPARSALCDLHVLVLDDEEDMRDLIAMILEHAGARVTRASSVATALLAIARDCPHVAVSDLAMPGADGYAFVAQVRASLDPKTRALPLVAMTAFARAEDRHRVLSAGFQRHVAKPIEPNELVEALAEVALVRPAAP